MRRADSGFWSSRVIAAEIAGRLNRSRSASSSSRCERAAIADAAWHTIENSAATARSWSPRHLRGEAADAMRQSLGAEAQL